MDSRAQSPSADAPASLNGVRTVELAVIVPVFNEAGNILALVRRLAAALEGIRWEAVFVDDDSTDGTVERLRRVARRDARVRLVHRIGRRGLASAVVEGVQATVAPYVAVIDGDLQHDETLLPAMLARLRAGEAELVVGSRYVEGGGTGDWSARRARMSRAATWLARRVTRVTLSDPMSGFFMVRREVFDGAVRRLSARGYKILLDLCASLPSAPRALELPYVFHARTAGESKLDSAVLWEYALLLADKTVGRVLPVRLLMFALVGGLGVGVHLSALALVHRAFGAEFAIAQALATVVAMTSNFFLNNLLTYRDRRLRGWRIVPGLLSFYAVCSVGLAANVAGARWLFLNGETRWWVAGLAGAVIGAGWNFLASSALTWRR